MSRFIATAWLCFLGFLSVADANVSATHAGFQESHKGKVMHIRVSAHENTTRFELNNSPAAKALYDQLPLTVLVEPYADNEMIFYPPKKLAIEHAPVADATVGTLAYYAPWGDVVMFYRDFGSASGLYALGHAVSGTQYIVHFTGEITITKAD